MNKIINNVKIEKIANNYKGLLIINNEKIFIDDAFINDVVDIQIYKQTSKYSLAKVINFIEKSPYRINSKCPHFKECGGCDLQDYDLDYYYKIKRDILYNNVKNIFPKIQENEIEIFKVEEGKRRRINLKYKNGKYGFFKKESNELAEIDNCINICNDINDVIKIIKNFHFKFLESMNITKIDNGISLNLFFINNPDIKELRQLDILKEKVINVYYYVNNSEEIAYFVKEKLKLQLSNYLITLPEQCFLQATKESQDFMIKVVCENLKNYKKVADLYCGVGTYTFPLNLNSKISSFEGDENMIDSIKNNSLNLNIPIKAFNRDLFNQPLIEKELKEFNGVVINPPRNGAENQCKFLSKSNVNKIVYISCSLEAFCRDVKLFKEKFILKKLYLVDQFFWSKHFEIIGIFEKMS